LDNENNLKAINLNLLSKERYGGLIKKKIVKDELLNFNKYDEIIFLKNAHIRFANFKNIDYVCDINLINDVSVNDGEEVLLKGQNKKYPLFEELKFDNLAIIKFNEISQLTFVEETFIFFENNHGFKDNKFGMTVPQTGQIVKYNTKKTILAFPMDLSVTFIKDCTVTFLEDMKIKESADIYKKSSSAVFRKDTTVTFEGSSFMLFDEAETIVPNKKTSIINLTENNVVAKQIIKNKTIQFMTNSEIYLIKETILVFKNTSVIEIAQDFLYER